LLIAVEEEGAVHELDGTCDLDVPRLASAHFFCV
jgi:hypothetical protein